MSEREVDYGYARWWEPVVAALLIGMALFIACLSLRSEVRDLQRRVGQLEATTEVRE